MSINPWDIALVIVVTLQATALAYISSPRWKALMLMLPLPFTTIVLSLGRPLDASNLLAMVVLLVYTLSVRTLYQYIPIVPAVALSALLYIVLGSFLANAIPPGNVVFWTSAIVIFILGVLLLRIVPPPDGPNHRTPLPLWQKLPAILLVVAIIVTIKNSLQGFASLFPLLGTVGAYEVRHNLWILVRSAPVLLCALTLMVIVTRLTQDHIGLGFALLLGWIIYIPVLIIIHRHPKSSPP